MKKILWLASWYPSREEPFAGDFIQRHARAVAAFCQVQVICVVKNKNKQAGQEQKETVSGNLAEALIYYNAPGTGIGLLDKFLSHRKYIRLYQRAIREYINKNGKPDSIHVHVAMKAGLLALWVKKNWNIPFVVTEHWTGYYRQSVPSLYDKNRWFRQMNIKVLRQASRLVPVTKHLGDTIRQHFADITFTAIPNVVNTELFFYKTPAPAVFRFIHVSGMNYQKNPEGILKACSLLGNSGYAFELFMLGNKEPGLMQIAEDTGLLNKTVFFEDMVPYAVVAKQMQQSNALLLFSRFENQPCVVLESLCCGLPVISTKVGGIGELIDESNGILIENGDVNGLVSAMQQLMDDYSKYDRASIAAKASAAFNYQVVGKRIAEVYDFIS